MVTNHSQDHEIPVGFFRRIQLTVCLLLYGFCFAPFFFLLLLLFLFLERASFYSGGWLETHSTASDWLWIKANLVSQPPSYRWDTLCPALTPYLMCWLVSCIYTMTTSRYPIQTSTLTSSSSWLFWGPKESQPELTSYPPCSLVFESKTPLSVKEHPIFPAVQRKTVWNKSLISTTKSYRRTLKSTNTASY